MVRPLAALLLVSIFAWSADASSWVTGPLDDGSSPLGANDTIRASIMWDRDGEGPEPASLVVAGNFTQIGGINANHIARLDPYTGQWRTLGTGLIGSVVSLTVFNGELIAAAGAVFRWSGSGWYILSPGIDAAAQSLTVYNGELIVGGGFTTIDGTPCSRIARWNGAGWAPLGSGTDKPVTAMAVHSGVLYAGGLFLTAGGLESKGFAAWNGSAWIALGVNGTVDAFTLHNGDLIVSGLFSTIVGVSANLVARTDGLFWYAMPGLSLGTYLSDSVTCLASVGDLYAAVALRQSDGSWNGRFVRWTGLTWAPIGETDEYAETLCNFNGELMAGGTFTLLDGAPMPHMARRLNGSWISFGGGTADRVNALMPFRGSVVAAGKFTQTDALGRIANNIVGWNGLAISIFGTGMNGEVRALEAFKYPGPFGDDELIAGGSFSLAGGVPAANVARWRVDPINAFPPPAWEPMGLGFNAGVYSIERHNGDSYAAGGFTQSGATWLGRVGRWNSSSQVWESLEYPGMNGPVYAIKSFGGYLYAGGNFHSAGNAITGSLARWNGSNWSQVGGYFLGTVYSLEVHGSVLVIGGDFPGFDNSPNISTWNGSSYVNLGVGGTDGPVRALHSSNGTLYVGGEFSTAFGAAAGGIAKYDGAWQQPHGGTDGFVYGISSLGAEVHAGGTFATVSGVDLLHSPRWGRYSPSGLPWIAQQPVAQSVSASADVSLSSQPALGYGATVQWLRFGQPVVDGPTGFGSTISGATSTTLILSNVSTADAGPYKMVATGENGSTSSNEVLVTVDGVTDVPELGESSVFYAMGPSPSPTASTQIWFSLARPARVQLHMHDVRGRLVIGSELGQLGAGRHHLFWNAGRKVAAGIYFVSLDADGERIGSRRLVVAP